jgi:mannonate dehydratase
MHRRNFFETAAAATLAAAGAPAPAQTKKASPRGKVKFKVGTQHSHADAVLKVMAALGVNHICSGELSPRLDEKWSVDSLKRFREHIESFGLKLEMVPIPLPSAYITRAPMPNIMLGKSPERDREIDQICQMIRNCAQAGIPAVKYNMSVLGVVRTQSTPGRGGAPYSTFNINASPNRNVTIEPGPISADQYWERITYFLNKVVPVATESKVKIACHPHDPGMPEPEGYRGVHTVLGSPAGLKRFVSINESPYHGLNFCQGTVSEMLKDPGAEIGDIIRYFGTRKKIFNVHFRNIKGTFTNFQETLPDNGDVNFVKIIRIYKEVGYDGMLMPDHVPHIEGDEGGRQAFAYCFGYIQALIQMVNDEG